MTGLILAGVTILLTYEIKGLLDGESAPPEIADSIRQIVSDTVAVNSVNELRTLQLGPEEDILAISINFQNDQTPDDIESFVFKMEKAVKEKFPVVKRIFMEVQSKEHHDLMLESYG